jgi:putative intracellular protease/amidase
MTSILIVLTGARTWTLNDGSAHPTGFWAEEFIAGHREFVAAGASVTIATPGGVVPLADELSLTPEMNGGDQAKIARMRSYLAQAQPLLEAAVAVEQVDPSAFDAIFVPGGHGPMEDLAVNESVGRLLVTFLDDPTKVVGSVCHGPASFLAATRANGSWAFEGRHITAFTDDEELQAGFAAKAPWLLETRLRELGAKVDAGPAWGSHVIVDGNLVTGQNPGSSTDAAKQLLLLVS